MSAVDVPVGLLGYGTVGSAVDRLLTVSAEQAADAALHYLRQRLASTGGIIIVGVDGLPAAAHTTPCMPWAARVGD